MEEAYQPISCSFYDRLEEAATLAKKVELKYHDNTDLISKKGIIQTFRIKEKVEFLILDTGDEIRLDKIHSLNGITLQNHC